MKTLFIFLSAFSSIGGIQKFNMLFMKALNDSELLEPEALSLYDHDCDEQYFSRSRFYGHAQNRFFFTLKTFSKIAKNDRIIIGHINIYLLGFFCLALRKKYIFVTHGIEVWENHNPLKGFILRNAYRVMCVSRYTRDMIVEKFGVDPEKIVIVYNALDPGFTRLVDVRMEKTENKKRDGIRKLLSVCRLSSAEKYKGYDKVIKSLPMLKKHGIEFNYTVAGKWDESEYRRITDLAKSLDVANDVILAGEVKDEQLVDYYIGADLFVMPSKGEGFGIVYLEALYCGLPVIAGNRDGSVEPLMDGDLGLLVDPDSEEEIAQTIADFFDGNIPESLLNRSTLRKKVIEKFGFQKFKSNIEQCLLS